ncbi:hypothetical protein BC941DRAFT_325479, partial [Chlamydoabsidia padenii]
KNPNWSHQKDKQLCLSWVKMSVDSIIGTDQSRDNMWKRILRYFRQEIVKKVQDPSTIPDRPVTGLAQRWNTIHPQVTKFCSFF